MHEKKSFGQRAEEFLSGKGFYIVLSICIAVVGISAWFVYASLRDAREEEASAAVSGMIDTSESKSAVEIITGGTDAEAEETEDADEPAAAEETAVPDIADLGEDAAGETEAAVEDSGDAVEAAVPASFVWPVGGEIVNAFTGSELVYSRTMADWRVHNGIDLAADAGSRVLAVSSGTVEEVRDDDLYGTTVVIDHGNGLKSIYSNLAGTPAVAEGDTVSAGSVIGSVGDTAKAEIGEVSHLHFEMTLDDAEVDPADYLPAK